MREAKENKRSKNLKKKLKEEEKEIKGIQIQNRKWRKYKIMKGTNERMPVRRRKPGRKIILPCFSGSNRTRNKKMRKRLDSKFHEK